MISRVNIIGKILTKKLCLKLILLSGPPRSGTTWLAREICCAPKTFPFLPECTLLTQQVGLYSQTLHHCDPLRFKAYFANKDNLRIYYRENIERLINQVAILNRKPKADTLILKDPEICLYLDEVKELFPPHKSIILVRDPRDVLASMKNVSVRKETPWDMEDAATKLFVYYYRIGKYLQQVDQDSIFVRYEDIVVGKTTILQEFLGQRVFHNQFSSNEIAAVRDQLDASDPFFSELYLQPTTQERVGSYKRILSDDEIKHVENVYSGVLQTWGY